MSPARWIQRVGRMGRAEIVFRARAAAREKAGLVTTAWRPRSWRRESLGALLVPSAGPLGTALERLDAGDWTGAHRALSEHFRRRVSRFLLSPHALPEVAEEIRRRFPRAAGDAAERATGPSTGFFDLLGYRELDCRRPGGGISWHADPVHQRSARGGWWSRVRYLDPANGDHKIIWELNRHQHFLALGRAAWLTGSPAYRDTFVRHLEDWLAHNPPLSGINWASMLELSLRSLSWLWAMHLFLKAPAADALATRRAPGEDGASDSTPWLIDLLVGLDRQLSHVAANLSVYFSPNTHLTGEALGLYVCGRALPELRSASEWEQRGREVLLEQAGLQVAADGGHAERSTHYQRYTLDFYLLALAMARATDDPAADQFAEILDRLASATRLLADVNGRLPHIGDDDGGSLFPVCGREPDDVRDSLASAAALLGRPELLVDAAPEETLWFLGNQPAWIIEGRPPRAKKRAAALASGSLRQTGYFVSRPSQLDHLVIDGGPHGYLNAGHAHADALSLTATLAGLPLFIDPGTATYTMSPELRDRFRATRMHNTLTLDGRSQSIPAGPFHWRSMAGAHVERWMTSRVFDFFEGTHDGYAPVTHRRRVVAVRGGPILVVDAVVGDRDRHAAEVHWHVDGAWRIEADDHRLVMLRHAGGARAWITSLGARTELLLGDDQGVGWHSPAYGRVEPSTTARLTTEGHPPFSIVTLFGLGTAAEAPVITRLVHEGADEAIALRVERDDLADIVIFGTPGERVAAAGVETDARLLGLRLSPNGRPSCVAMVDGTFARLTEDGTSLAPAPAEPGTRNSGFFVCAE